MPDDLGSMDKEVRKRIIRRNRAVAISISHDCKEQIEDLLVENERLKAKVEELKLKLRPIPHIG